MSKKKNIRGGGGIPTGGQAGMLQQVQRMQQEMQAAQEALEHETVEVSVGGGAITIVITGHQRIQAVTIKPELIDTSDAEWANDLQDLLVVAINQAIEKSQVMAAERMEAITGPLRNIPGLGGLLG